MDILGIVSLVLMLFFLLATGILWAGFNYLQTKNFQYRYKKYKLITIIVGLLLSLVFFIILLVLVKVKG